DGGNIYIEGVSDLGALIQFRYKKELKAEDGKNGKTSLNDGCDGDDLILKVPIGTVIHNLTNNETTEIIKIGERLSMAKGGKGGKGNYKFRSPKNTSPEQFQEGLPGEEYKLRLELKLIADVGLIGLPNVGKSSLLNELTNAKSKVANYNFTTLEPNLGVYYELILADIPGLIEGASAGKGLGIKFLRHIERTKTLFHLISAESADPLKDYKTIREELGKYNKALLDKPEYIFISKSDMIGQDELDKKKFLLKKNKIVVEVISIHDSDSINRVEEILRGVIKRKHQW
ncbi:MAG: Obg family GTPase CgtA, partial [Candidatus Portnoybacteria bacterium RBG_13_41_18]